MATKKAKHNNLLLEWQLQLKLLAESSQAQKILETHFRFQHEEDRMMDEAGNEFS